MNFEGIPNIGSGSNLNEKTPFETQKKREAGNELDRSIVDLDNVDSFDSHNERHGHADQEKHNTPESTRGQVIERDQHLRHLQDALDGKEVSESDITGLGKNIDITG